MSDGSRKKVAATCRDIPGADVSDACCADHEAWKAGGKMLPCTDAIATGVSVRGADVEATEMREQVGAAQNAAYLHKSCVGLLADEEDLQDRIVGSYELIRSKLPAATRKGLPSRKTKD